MKGRTAELRLAQSEPERARLFCIPARYWTLGRSSRPSPAHHDPTPHPCYVFRALLRSFLVLVRKDYAFAKLTSFRPTTLCYPIGSAIDGWTRTIRLPLLFGLLHLSANDRQIGSMYMPWCLVAAALHQHAAGLVPLLRLFAKQRRYLPTISLSVITD